jgi:hypothetical protein
MVVQVLSKARHSLSRLIPEMSVAGDSLMTRLRSAWFGLLGVSTAAALALIALAFNQGFPGIAEFPFPAAPAELGVAQNEKVASGAPHSASRPSRTRAPSSSPGDEPRQTPSRTPAEVKTVESRTIATAPAPELVQTEQPPPPSTDGQGSAPQPQSPSSSSPPGPSPTPSPTTASLSVPKGKGAGLTRAPGKQAKIKGHPAKIKDQPAEAKAPLPPVVPKVAPPPSSGDIAQSEKHPGKSGKGH